MVCHHVKAACGRTTRASAAGHPIDAASAAFFAGHMRTLQGDYLQAFVIAGSTGVIAAVLAMMIRGNRRAAVAV